MKKTGIVTIKMQRTGKTDTLQALNVENEIFLKLDIYTNVHAQSALRDWVRDYWREKFLGYLKGLGYIDIREDLT